MQLSTKIITLSSVDPRRNLVFEQELLKRLGNNEINLLIWQNSDSVIIGKGQNPWCEADSEYLQQQQIPLIRRHSGGGAVFNDVGNINFSLMMPQHLYHRHIATGIIQTLLKQWDIVAAINDRNDMVIRSGHQEYKFSGSAYRVTQGKYLHHGTLLVESNLDRLRRSLKPPALDIKAKGIASCRSHVINLSSLAPALGASQLMKALPLGFKQHFASWGEVALARADAVGAIDDDHPLLVKQRHWQWLYGQTPRFLQRFKLALHRHTYSGCLRVHQGQIVSVLLTGGYLARQWSVFFSELLDQCRYRRSDVAQRLAFCDLRIPSKGECSPSGEDHSLLTKEMGECLVAQTPV